MCEEYLKDVNPDLTHLSLAERRPERVRLNALNEDNLLSPDDYESWDGKCILKVFSIGYGIGHQFDIEKTGTQKVGFSVKSIRTTGNCCWKILM